MRKKTASTPRLPARRANRPAAPAIDTFDRKILSALVENARASNVEIAQKVGLSEAPCSRRIRRLEADEVILGYQAQLDHEAIGIGFVAWGSFMAYVFTFGRWAVRRGETGDVDVRDREAPAPVV